MPNRSKQKGNRRERELVKLLHDRGYTAERARGSDGRSLGLHEEVDVAATIHPDLAGGKPTATRFQVKGRAKLPKWLHITEGVDAVAICIDGGGGKPAEWYLLQRLEDAV